MPAKATIYNLKCDPIFDFGTGPRNAAYYNPQGNNILSLINLIFNKFYMIKFLKIVFFSFPNCDNVENISVCIHKVKT